MSLASNATPSQAIRCGDRNHRGSIARQRKNATTTPREQALAIVDVVRKRIADSQPLPDLDKYRLGDTTWGELLDVLTADELSAIADAYGGDDISEDDNRDYQDLSAYNLLIYKEIL
jgi:hypothetical protein